MLQIRAVIVQMERRNANLLHVCREVLTGLPKDLMWEVREIEELRMTPKIFTYVRMRRQKEQEI